MNQNTFTTRGIAAVMPAALATGLFTSLITFQEPDGNTTSTGAPSGVYVPIAGLTGIMCMDAPDSVDRFNIESAENRQQGQIESEEWRHVLLQGYYSLLSPSTNWGNVGWRAVVTGATGEIATYDVNAAEQDSQSQMTRISLLKVTV